MPILYYNHVTILKVAATMFITWFHFKSFIPTPIDKLFIGGMLGNSLFFYCSGYLSSIKTEQYKGEWLINKWSRIMPSVWIGTILLLLVKDIKIYNFIYPTSFWFINALLIFYIIFYILKKIISKRKILCVNFILVIHTFYYYFFVDHTQIVMDGGGLKIWFYCFLFFLYGFYTKNKNIKGSNNKYSLVKSLITIVVFYLYKELANIYSPLIFWQFIIQPLILFVFIHFSIESAHYIASIKISNKLKHVLSIISNLTLDIYVIQITIINLIEQINIKWPYKIGISIILILIGAYWCNKISNLAGNIIKKKLNLTLKK